jgi:hypothetical protein
VLGTFISIKGKNGEPDSEVHWGNGVQIINKLGSSFKVFCQIDITLLRKVGGGVPFVRMTSLKWVI